MIPGERCCHVDVAEELAAMALLRRVTRRQVLRLGSGALAGLVTACRLPPLRDLASQPRPLRFYSPRFADARLAQVYRTLFDEFEAGHPSAPIVAETEPVASQALYTLRHRAAAGQMPDLVGYVYLPALVQSGLVRPLAIDAADATRALWSDLPAPQQAAATFGGQVYGLPIEVTSSSTLIYRKRLFTLVGVDPVVAPTSWTDFVDLARRATRGLDQRGFALIAQPSIEATYAHWYDWFATSGGSLFAPDGALALDRGDAALETLRFYTNLSVGVKVTLPNSTELDEAKAADALAAGQVALIQDGSARLTGLRAVHPDLTDDLGVFPLPWRSRDVATIRTETIALSASTKQVDLAAELSSFLAGQAASLRRFTLVGLLPPGNEARRLARAQADPLQQFFFDRLAGPSISLPGDERWPAIASRGGLMVHDIICGCVAPAEALQKAVADLARLPVRGEA
jgi:ABC-type glycerol-3-phosphate transport system substrate-binding protein